MPANKNPNPLLRAISLSLLATVALSCGGDSGNTPEPSASAMCFADPKTHVEIINSCADPTGIDKPARLAKFRPGAQLQPLP